MHGRFGVLLGCALLGALTVGCGDDGAAGSGGSGGGGACDDGPKTIDPTSAPFGKTYGEWAGAWVTYVNEVPALGDECVIAEQDPSGALCAHGQDPESPVFFLTGNFGGTSFRDQCVVPAGKAIFFPVLVYVADNGGVPEDQLLTDAELRGLAEKWPNDVDRASLVAEVDGCAIPDIESFRSGLFEYSCVLPPEPNRYTCLGVPGVTGLVAPGYGDGWWVMLEPMEAGTHTIHFAGKVEIPNGTFVLDVTYELVVE